MHWEYSTLINFGKKAKLNTISKGISLKKLGWAEKNEMMKESALNIWHDV